MPDVLDRFEARDREAEANQGPPWLRRLFVLLLAAVPVVALFNVVGQRATNATSHSAIVDLTVHAPTRVRPGLLFQARFTVLAHQDVSNAKLVLGKGWLDGLTVNTIEPSPSTESPAPGGGVELSLGSLTADVPLVQYLEYQVNPTSISSRQQTAAVTVGGQQLAVVDRTMTVVP